jgi:hypothetical protein
MSLAKRLSGLGRTLGLFLAGNVFVQGINLVAGLAILWILPIEEYSLYIVCSALAAIANLGSDPGFSQALVTLGSKAQGNNLRIERIFQACLTLRRSTMRAMAAMVALAGLLVGFRQHYPPASWGLAVFLAMAGSWAQSRLGPYNGLFNIYQDTAGIIRTSYLSGLMRLALTLTVCHAYPSALTALAINLVAYTLQDRLCRRQATRYLEEKLSTTNKTIEREVIAFVRPLIPGVVYYLIQGQIVILILTWLGKVETIAEVGALSRLGQLFVVLSSLNGFFIQPHFSRIADAELFRRRLALLIAVFAIFAAFVMWTTYQFDYLWVMLLGSKYVHLKTLVSLAVGSSLLGLFGGFLYFVVIATGITKHQIVQIPMGIGVQVLVLFLIGVGTTRDAILVSYAPALSYCLLQMYLLIRFTKKSQVAI